MAYFSNLSAWFDRLADTPAAQGPMRRYVRYWLVMFLAGVLVHSIALIAFSAAGVWLMVAVNCVSVPLYLTTIWMLRRGWTRAPYWMAFGEISIHGMLATLSVGLGVGFEAFIFPVVILAFVQPFYGLRGSILIAVASVAALLLVKFYAAQTAPWYDVPQALAFMPIAATTVIFPLVAVAMVAPFVVETTRAEAALTRAFEESESLLLTILPASIATRLKAGEREATGIVDEHADVAILFADIVGFTQMAERLPPRAVSDLLNTLFRSFDALVAAEGAEKIKTIGDAYMAAAGAPEAHDDPAGAVARIALSMHEAAAQMAARGGPAVQLRIGLARGRVVAGVIGAHKFTYDLWGDAVNLAARMEQTAPPGTTQLPAAMAEALADRFVSSPVGQVDMRGKGAVETCRLMRDI